MSVTIRDIRPEDWPRWGGLWAGYLDFYEASVDPGITKVTWARLNDPNEPMFALVAEAGHEMLGFVHCVLHRGTWAINDLCYLEDLFVAPTARGMGIGRALIEAVYARADANNWDRVYWLTHETNTTARALYDKLAQNRGFIQYRR